MRETGRQKVGSDGIKSPWAQLSVTQSSNLHFHFSQCKNTVLTDSDIIIDEHFIEKIMYIKIEEHNWDVIS